VIKFSTGIGNSEIINSWEKGSRIKMIFNNPRPKSASISLTVCIHSGWGSDAGEDEAGGG